MKNSFNISMAVAFAVLLLTFSACQQEDVITPEQDQDISAASWSGSDGDGIFYALSSGNQLDKLSMSRDWSSDWNTSWNGYGTADGKVLNSVTITGVQAGEKILGIDFRPATGKMYALGSTSRIYIIDPNTGVAQMVGAGPFTPSLAAGYTTVGFDFNPVVDRIRIVTDNDQNLRVNPNNGMVAAVDSKINPGTAQIAAVAYRNNFAGATSTVLYDIDPISKKLFRQDPPNAGTLVLVGSLGLNIYGEGGFDIAPNGYNGLALFKVNGKSTLFTVSLRSGSTRVRAQYAKNYTGLAIPTTGYSSEGSR